jgi:hypothetical protein
MWLGPASARECGQLLLANCGLREAGKELWNLLRCNHSAGIDPSPEDFTLHPQENLELAPNKIHQLGGLQA